MRAIGRIAVTCCAIFAGLGAGARTDAGEVYVTNQAANTISVIDPVTHRVVATIGSAGWAPHNVTFTPDGAQAWVAHLGSANVSIIDTAKREVIGVLPEHGLCEGKMYPRGPESQPQGIAEACSRVHEVAFSPDGRLAYLNNLDSDDIWVFETATRKEVGRIRVGPSARMVFSRDGRLAYVVVSRSQEVLVLDTATQQVVNRIAVSGDKGVWGLALSPDGKLLYVTTGKANQLLIYETELSRLLAEVPVGRDAHTVVLSSDGGRAYVTNRQDNTVMVIDAIKREVIATLKTGTKPDLCALQGQYLYVTERADNTVLVVDTASGEAKARIPMGKQPHGIAVRP